MELGDLIAAVKQGDAAAQSKLVIQFQDMAFGIAYARLGDFHLAEDAAQDAFLEVFRNLDALKDPAGFPNWLRRIVLSQCDRLSRGKRRTMRRLDAAMQASHDRTPDRIAARKETTQEILSAVVLLPEAQRMAITLFYLGERTERDVANYLGVPLGTVKKRLHDARHNLKERLISLVEDKLKKVAPSKDSKFAAGIALMQAAQSGNLTRAKELLRADPELVRSRTAGRWGERTPLHAAAEHGHVELCKLLLDHGADVMARDDGDNATPLHWAGHVGNIPIAELLLKHGADINDRQDWHQAAPLGWSITLSQNHPDFAEFLLKNGAKLDIFAAIALNREQDVRAMLAADKSLLTATQSKFEDHRKPLHFAAAKNNVRFIDILLELGASRDEQDDKGHTPIDAALVNGQIEAFQHLTALGATPAPKLKAQYGTIERAIQVAKLSRAVQANDISAVRELLKRDPSLARATITDAWQTDFTPLHQAAWNGFLEIATLLLDHGADLTVRDGSYNATPLGWSNENDQQAMSDLLLKRGTLVDAGQAAAINALDVLQKAVAADPTLINATLGYGTPLHHAIVHGRLNTTRWLLDNGADISLQNRNGQTALQLAEVCAAGAEGPNGGARPRADHAEILELVRQYTQKR
jgi:RNA polymerase sigma factor (sigma-70 family)